MGYVLGFESKRPVSSVYPRRQASTFKTHPGNSSTELAHIIRPSRHLPSLLLLLSRRPLALAVVGGHHRPSCCSHVDILLRGRAEVLRRRSYRRWEMRVSVHIRSFEGATYLHLVFSYFLAFISLLHFPLASPLIPLCYVLPLRLVASRFRFHSTVPRFVLVRRVRIPARRSSLVCLPSYLVLLRR